MNNKKPIVLSVYIFKCLLVLCSSHLNAFNTIQHLNFCYRYQTLPYSFKSNVECNSQQRLWTWRCFSSHLFVQWL